MTKSHGDSGITLLALVIVGVVLLVGACCIIVPLARAAT